MLNNHMRTIIILLTTILFYGCDGRGYGHENIEIKGIKLNTSKKVDSKIITLLGEKFSFTTSHLNNGVSYQILAWAKDENGFRKVSVNEVETLKESVEKKYGVTLNYNGLKDMDGNKIQGKYIAEKDNVLYRISFFPNEISNFKYYYDRVVLCITDLHLKEIAEKEKCINIQNDI